MHFVTNGPCFRLCRSLLRACGSLILGDCEKKKIKTIVYPGSQVFNYKSHSQVKSLCRKSNHRIPRLSQHRMEVDVKHQSKQATESKMDVSCGYEV